jgi:ferrous iron transport protein B
MAERKLTVALAGNPNSGKTTVFNALTGARQHVGNYPGVTVERKEGVCRFEGYEITVVDLPGTYSLSAQSLDEVVARNFIIEEHPDVVVDIVDASNLERNLYLATQLMELGAPLVIAFNMSDVAESMGFQFDLDRLSQLLGAPIVPTVGHKRQGIPELLSAVVGLAAEPGRPRPATVRYRRDIDREVQALEEEVGADAGLVGYPARWLALKLLENDSEVRRAVHEAAADAEGIVGRAEEGIGRLRRIYEDEPAVVIAEARYGFISGACEQAVESTVLARHDLSDRIDKVVTHPVLGIPIFLALMWLVFQVTFTAGEPAMRGVEALFQWLAGVLNTALPEGVLRSLLVDGVIGGVGGVLVFLPNILLLFLAIAFLEDTGYMARSAFIMDRIMSKIGLHGKSFIPLLIGFGCTVPAIMATRTLENRRDRMVTMLITPLMSCGARLPVYILLAGTFFGEQAAGNVIFSLYLLGIVVAVVMAKVFRKWLLPGPTTPFVIELPPYRMPTVRGLLIHMWERGWLYLKKAGTIILGMSVLIWALSSFPRDAELDRAYASRIESAGPARAKRLEDELAQKQLRGSVAGRMGHGVQVVLEPAGLGDWRLGTALFAGFGAKELVVSTLGTLYGLGEVDEESEALHEALRQDLTPLRAYALMVFVLLYIPCMATVAVIWKETNSWRWPLFVVLYTTTLAWVAAVTVYQGGRLLGLG